VTISAVIIEMFQSKNKSTEIKPFESGNGKYQSLFYAQKCKNKKHNKSSH